MKLKRFISLVVSTAMTLSVLSGFAMTSASAQVIENDNTVSWFASASDGAPIEGTTDDGSSDCATIAAGTDLMDGTECSLVTMVSSTYKTVSFNGTDEEGNAVSTPSELTGRLTLVNETVYEEGAPGRSFKFTADKDGVIDVYVKVGAGKPFVIEATDGSGKVSWANPDSSTVQKKISAPVTAGKSYYLYGNGHGADFFGVVFTVGGEYEAPTTYSWAASSSDFDKKAGAELMTGLTLVSDNSSTNKAYISAEASGKLENNEETGEKVASGSALKFIAYADGALSVTMIDLGTATVDEETGEVIETTKSVTPVIYGVTEKGNVFEYTTSGNKETVVCTADVTAGNTYYIVATGTSGRFSAAQFTPMSKTPDITDEPEIPDETAIPEMPDTTQAPEVRGITYANGTVTVKADEAVTEGVLIIASYEDNALTDVTTEALTFTNGFAEVSNLSLVNGTKLMAWNSLEDMRPICAAETVSDSSATPKPTAAPTEKPDDSGLPDDIIWLADDSIFDEYANMGSDDHDGGTYGGLTIGNSYHIGSKAATYTHSDGTEYSFKRAWQGGTGNDIVGEGSSRNLSFTPEASCVVTVIFNGNGGTDRVQYISQNGEVIGTAWSVDPEMAVLTADILDPTAGPVVIYGGGSNKNVFAIFVEYYDATPDKEITGMIENASGEDLSNDTVVFTNTNPENSDDVVAVPFAEAYAVNLTKGETYKISIKGKEDVICPTVATSLIAVTKNRNAQSHNIKLVKIEDLTVTGTVSTLSSNDLRTPVYDYDSSIGAALIFTKEGETEPYTTVQVGADGTYEATLLSNETYTVTLSGTTDYTLSPMSVSYELVGGSENPYKNVLLMKNTPETVEYKETITVGDDKDYPSVSEAIAAVRKMTRTANQLVTIEIDPGTYEEQVYVDVNNIALKAADPNNKPTIQYYYGVGYIYYSVDDKGYYNADRAVSKTTQRTISDWGPALRIANTTGFYAEDIDVVNTFNVKVTDAEVADGVTPGGNDAHWNFDRVKGADARSSIAIERAAAINAGGSQIELYRCSFKSSQDTFGTGASSMYVKECDIYGGTDYICGGNNVVFDNCNLIWYGLSDKDGGGYITACKTSSTNDNGYLFINCTIMNNPDTTMKCGTGSYGRNWGGANCKTVFVNTKLASGVGTPTTWVKMGGELNTSKLYVYNTKNANGAVVTTSNTSYNLTEADVLAINPYTYFNDWTPVNYTGDIPEITEYVTTWYFGKANGAPEYAIQGAGQTVSIAGTNNAETTQTMVVDATNGKFNNATRTDDLAQVNDGTKFTFPVVEGSVITFDAYNDGTLTIDGTSFKKTGSYIVPAGVTSVTATANGVGYMPYIKTTTPAANGKPQDSAQPTEAPVEPTETPVEPTEAPIKPTETPIDPTEEPVKPTEAPIEPTEEPVKPTEAPVEPTEVTVSGTIALTGIYNNGNNKVDNYKMKSDDLVLKLKTADADEVTAMVTGVQDGNGEDALAYTAELNTNTSYTVVLGDTDGNEYNVTSGGSVTTSKIALVNNIIATKTYTVKVPVTISSAALAKMTGNKLYITFSTAGGITPETIEFNKSDITAGEQYMVTAHNFVAADVDGSSNNWFKSTLSTEAGNNTLPNGVNAPSSNQDSLENNNSTEANPAVKFQSINATVLVSEITLTPVEEDGVWELKDDKIEIHPDNTLTVNAAVNPVNADNTSLDWSAAAVTPGASGVTVSGGVVTVAADATGGSEWTIKAAAKDGSNVNSSITIKVVDATDSLGTVAITDEGKAVLQVLPGKTVTAAVSAKDGVDTSALTYKWLSAPKGSDKFTEISGANASSYAIPADMAEKSTLKVVVSVSGYDDAEATVEVTNLPIFSVDSFVSGGLNTRAEWTISDSQKQAYADLGEPFGDLNQYTKYIDAPSDASITIPETGNYKLYILMREYSGRGYVGKFTKAGSSDVSAEASCINGQVKVATAGSTNYGVVVSDAVALEQGDYTIAFDRSSNGTQFMAFLLVKAE